MARYAYDVNTTQKYIDVHKQFNGGLKTVDTDDALGAVFLRQAENVSLSEFGFIEKRYGTFENFKRALPAGATTLQGYWEFKGYFIYAVDGKFYVNDSETHSEIIKEIDDEDSDNHNKDWRYPTLPQYPFQPTTYRDMNAVQISDILYIFTGVYPVYAAVVNDELKFYWFSVDVPTYDEIVVVGHNLLEDDYENVYGYTTPNDFETASSSNVLLSNDVPRIVSASHYPRIPFVKDEDNEDGSVNFDFVTQFPQDMNTFSKQGSAPFFEISLDQILYRSSGAGSSNIDFIQASTEDVNFDVKNNYNGSVDINFVKEELISKQRMVDGETVYSKTQYLETSSGATIITPAHFAYTYIYKTNFTLDKEEFLKNDRYSVQTFIESVGGYEAFNLSPYENDYEDFSSGITVAGENLHYVNITPISDSGEKLDKYTVKVLTSEIENSYSFDRPANIYKTLSVVGYNIEFYHRVVERRGPSEDPIGPTTIDDNFALYYNSLTIFGEKSPATSGNLITSSFTPALKLELSNLIAGTYDFQVIFSREEYQYLSATDTLQLVNVEYFSYIVKNVSITAEKLQDYPSAENFPLEIAPIWSCNKVIEHFGKLMVWGSEKEPTAVFYSFPDRPTYFPTKFYLDFKNNEGSAVESVAPYMNILVVQTQDRTWGVRGNSGYIDSPAPYIPFSINPTVGTIAYKSVRPVRNHLFFLSKQGVIALKSLYAADEQYNIDFMDLNIRNIVPQDSEAIGIQFDNQYWLNFPNFGITLRWYIDKKAWVKDIYNVWNEFNGVFKWQVVNGKLEFITKPSSFEGDNTYIYKIGVDYSLPYDLGQTYATKLETSFLNQNYPFHPKNYKESKLDFTLQNEYNLSRDALYQMETNEDITNNELHKIDNVSVLKNHTYRIYYSFGTYEIEPFNGGSFEDVFDIDSVLDAGGFDSYVDEDVIDGYWFNITTDLKVTSVSIKNKDEADNTVYLSGDDITITEADNGSYTVQFYVPNVMEGEYDILVYGNFEYFDGGAVMYDVTYDDTLAFSTWVISEEGTLNFDNIDSYDQAKAEIGFSLQDRLGEWTFGTSDFGNKVTAVKTIKLSGKGYNSKIYIEDFTNSKWTLESLGITYKMKRARSR